MRERRAETILLMASCLLLATITTGTWVRARGFDYLEHGAQLERHQRLLAGNAGNPWQYRMLSAWLVEGTIRLVRAAQLPAPHATGFTLFRFAQDALIFVAAILYYRRLGATAVQAVLGAMLLAWGMSYAHYDSDLQFSTFFDVLFYLLAGLAIVSARPLWIVPITVLAAVNRETSGLIPLLCVPAAGTVGNVSRGTARAVAGTALVLYAVIFAALRIGYGKQELIVPYGELPGLPLLTYNVLRPITWWQLLLTLGVVPLVAMAGYRNWPPVLRRFFWTVVPLWTVIHFTAAVVAESRLFLVPQALVFIPAALLYAHHGSADPRAESASQSAASPEPRKAP